MFKYKYYESFLNIVELQLMVLQLTQLTTINATPVVNWVNFK